MSPSPARIVGITVGALVILGIGVYGPATLLGPLPVVSVTPESPALLAADTVPLPMPEAGGTAVALVRGADGEVIQQGGSEEPVPIGAVAKLVTVLVTVEGQPLTGTEPGPSIPIGPQDYNDYFEFQRDGSRTVPVVPGESWSERDVVRATLLSSSNNHANTLARWAYGTVDAYVEAANAWLARNGFEQLRVDDATGLSEASAGTPAEVARLGAIVAANPVLMGILDAGEVAGPGERSVPDNVGYLADAGVRAMSRSYTDLGWISFVFAVELPPAPGDASGQLAVGAMLGVPDYETLDPAVTALADAMRASSAPVAVIPEGSRYATVRSVWGDTAGLVASTEQSVRSFGETPGEPTISVEEFTTGRTGEQLGRVTVPLGANELSSPLELDAGIHEPGVIWRLTHPIPLITELFAPTG